MFSNEKSSFDTPRCSYSLAIHLAACELADLSFLRAHQNRLISSLSVKLANFSVKAATESLSFSSNWIMSLKNSFSSHLRQSFLYWRHRFVNLKAKPLCSTRIKPLIIKYRTLLKRVLFAHLER